jgi:hypothetical protein
MTLSIVQLNALIDRWNCASGGARLELYKEAFQDKFTSRDTRNIRRVYLKLLPFVFLMRGWSPLCSFFCSLHPSESCGTCPTDGATRCILAGVQQDAFSLLAPTRQASLLRELEGHRQRSRLILTLPDVRAQARVIVLIFTSWQRRDILVDISREKKTSLLETVQQLQVKEQWIEGGAWCVATKSSLDACPWPQECSCCNTPYVELETTVIKMKCGIHSCCDACYERGRLACPCEPQALRDAAIA